MSAKKWRRNAQSILYEINGGVKLLKEKEHKKERIRRTTKERVKPLQASSQQKNMTSQEKKKNAPRASARLSQSVAEQPKAF